MGSRPPMGFEKSRTRTCKNPQGYLWQSLTTKQKKVQIIGLTNTSNFSWSNLKKQWLGLEHKYYINALALWWASLILFAFWGQNLTNMRLRNPIVAILSCVQNPHHFQQFFIVMKQVIVTTFFLFRFTERFISLCCSFTCRTDTRVEYRFVLCFIFWFTYCFIIVSLLFRTSFRLFIRTNI